jgi:hypothetical protein
MMTKTADSKGRITLGKKFANKTFIVEQTSDTEINLEVAAVIPEREMWLYRNPKARKAVFDALERAKATQFSDSPPDLDAARALAEQIED